MNDTLVFSTEGSRKHNRNGVITIRCTRSRGPRGFFCLQDVCRGPVNVDVIQTYYRASTHQGVFSDGTIMSKLLGKRWNLRFSILNLLLLMVAASVVIFATVREIHYEKTRTQLENRISDLESTNKAKL